MGDSVSSAINFVGGGVSDATNLVSGGLQDLGVGPQTAQDLGAGVVDAGIGAGVGAAAGAIGGNPGLGALTGAGAGALLGGFSGNDFLGGTGIDTSTLGGAGGGITAEPLAAPSGALAPASITAAVPASGPTAPITGFAGGGQGAASSVGAGLAPGDLGTGTDDIIRKAAGDLGSQPLLDGSGTFGPAAPAAEAPPAADGATAIPGAARYGKPDVPAAPAAAKSDGLFGSGIGVRDALGVAAAGGGLLAAGLTSPNVAGKDQLQLPGGAAPIGTTLSNTAANLNTQGTTNLNAINTGVLPPGAQGAIDQAAQSAKAAVKSHFAGLGLAGSSMEATALGQVDMNAAKTGFDTAMSLAQLGLNETSLSSTMYSNLLKDVLGQDQAFQAAVANFAGAFGGGKAA